MKQADPRVADWPLMSSPLPTIGFAVGYLLAIYFGTKFMKNRDAYNVKGLLIVYDITMVLLSGYMSVEIFRQAYTNNFRWVCNFVDYSDKGLGLAKVLWIFYASKALEFMDTIFFIVRKKNDQISFLHVYHHVSVILLWWIGVRFVPGGDSYFSAMQNSFVHVLMYAYYLLSALGIYAWWKPYLTQIQMIQFFANILHIIIPLMLYTQEECTNIPKWMGYGMILYMSSLLILFLNFFIKAYINKRRIKKKPE